MRRSASNQRAPHTQNGGDVLKNILRSLNAYAVESTEHASVVGDVERSCMEAGPRICTFSTGDSFNFDIEETIEPQSETTGK